jgi:ATP-dependent Clp protease ATP-binding subunit ClpA
MVNEQVTDEDIAAVIAAWTGIPVGGCCRARARSSCTWSASSAAA